MLTTHAYAVAPALLDRNPDVVLHHMHDQLQDVLMAERMSYSRVKWRRLPEAYALRWTGYITRFPHDIGTLGRYGRVFDQLPRARQPWSPLPAEDALRGLAAAGLAVTGSTGSTAA